MLNYQRVGGRRRTPLNHLCEEQTHRSYEWFRVDVIDSEPTKLHDIALLLE